MLIKWLIEKESPRWLIRETLYLKYALIAAVTFVVLDFVRSLIGLDGYISLVAIAVLTVWYVAESIGLPRKEYEREYLRRRIINLIVSDSKVKPISSARPQSRE